jgi:hypothetical protein
MAVIHPAGRRIAAVISCFALFLSVLCLNNLRNKDTKGSILSFHNQHTRITETGDSKFYLPVLTWHGVKASPEKPRFYIPPSPDHLPFPSFERYPAAQSHEEISSLSAYSGKHYPFRNSIADEKLRSDLNKLHVSRKVEANTLQAVRENLLSPISIKRIESMAEAANSSAMVIVGGPDHVGSDPDIEDMIAVLEGMHVSAQVVSDSTRAVQAGLLKPSDIIRIASAVKERQVQNFLDAQANMDR